MKIGIVGTGNMGRTLGVRWARAGHDVMFGSRDEAKAKEAALDASKSARWGDFAAAVSFGDVILYTLRGVPPSRVLREPQALVGKIVIDCNNSDLDPSHPGEFAPAPVPSFAEQLAIDAPGARVVQAFNTVPHRIIELERERLAPRRISVFLCSDDAAAKATVKRLAEDLGFIGVDSGELRRARVVDGVVDFIRFQIATMGRGPLTTISLDGLVGVTS
jgi:8-hydroxy-5-deazaflavin:NADPH oxidoreductase